VPDAGYTPDCAGREELMAPCTCGAEPVKVGEQARPGRDGHRDRAWVGIDQSSFDPVGEGVAPRRMAGMELRARRWAWSKQPGGEGRRRR